LNFYTDADVMDSRRAGRCPSFWAAMWDAFAIPAHGHPRPTDVTRWGKSARGFRLDGDSGQSSWCGLKPTPKGWSMGALIAMQRSRTHALPLYSMQKHAVLGAGVAS